MEEVILIAVVPKKDITSPIMIGNVKIQKTVVIIVTPVITTAIIIVLNPGLIGNILKSTIAQIPIQDIISLVVSQVKIQPTIVVIISPGDS